MQDIITSLSKPDLINIVKLAIKEVKEEETKSSLEKAFSLNQARKILKVSNYKIRALIEKGEIKMLKNNKILASELNKYLENLQ